MSVSEVISTGSTPETTVEASEQIAEHAGPHILSAKGTVIHDWNIFGLPITTTVFSTWVFMAVLFLIIAVFFFAIRTNRLPRTKAIGLDVTNRLLAYATNLFGERGAAHKYMWLVGGIMIVVFLGNIIGLISDWFVIVSDHNWLGEYFRPVFSDLNTTLVLSITVILVAQITAFYLKGPVHQLKHYLWNYHGESTAEKIVSVFVGWLHFFGEFIRVGSLSMRLFLNILVGAILISVAVYVGSQIPAFHTGAFRLLSLPFWFFELLVAFLQAYIFMTLSSLYIRESLPEKHH